MGRNRRFGWHSGVIEARDCKLQGDLYIQDDIIFSDVSAGTVGVTGGIDMDATTSAVGIAMGGTFSTAAINIDGTCQGSGIALTISYDLSASAISPKSIYSQQTLTGEDASDAGGMQGIRSDTDNATYDNSWQVSLQGRATATGTATVGDTIGVYASVKTVGALTDVSGGTGSIVAFKGDVSDSPGSAWDANVHGVMIGYASQINYGGKTSLFFGYTHATAYCDYGLLIDNYSPNMTAGIYLTDTAGATPAMATGIDIDANCTTGISISGATGYAIDISTAGQFRMGVMGTGIPTVTATPYAVEIHTETGGDIVSSGTGLTCGIRSRYEVSVAQTNNISFVAVEGRLRVKEALADGNHAGIMGTIEASESKVMSGTATTLRSAGSFALDFSSGSTITSGWLCGIVIDSSVDGSISMASCTFVGMRIKTGSGKEQFEHGIYLDDASAVTGITLGTTTTGIEIGAATTAISLPAAVTNLFALPAEATAPVSDTTNVVFNTDPVKISILVGGAQYYMLAAKDFA